MNQRIVCHHVVVASMLLVCLAVGLDSRLLAASNEGTPRPTYASDFAPGMRVVLLQDAPTVGAGLKVGMSGIVICCDQADCSQRVLVSWSQWRGGRNEEAACAIAPAGLYPPGSAAWVDPTRVRLGVPFEDVGKLQGEGGCLYLSTDDGKKVYRLMVSPAFQAQWWVAMPGTSFRVRGLLSTVNMAQGACAAADGDIYHPLLMMPSWSTEPHSFEPGPFRNGDRVVLIGEANPYGAVNLPRGATGTIICSNPTVERSMLVSWDLWPNGIAPDAYMECYQRFSGMYPPDSVWWVAKMDLAKYYESDCGTLETTTLCCGAKCTEPGLVGLFVPFKDVFCLPDLAVTAPLPQGQYRAIGLYTPYEELMNPGAVTPDDPAMRTLGGVIFDSFVTACHVPNCCNPPYVPGDRVMLLVNEPGGAPGLFSGRGGTVVCCNPNDPVAPILVSWDNWTGGEWDNEACEVNPDWYPETSGWWVACSEIKRVVLPELFDYQEYRRFLPQTVGVGKHVKISGMIGNSGGANSGPFAVNIYLSRDRTIATDDILLSQAGYYLGVGASAELNWLNPLPAAVTPGTYYVGWIIDPGNQVAEEDETNNVVVLDGQLTVTSN